MTQALICFESGVTAIFEAILAPGTLTHVENTEGIWIQPLGIFPEVPKNGGNMWEFPWQLVKYSPLKTLRLWWIQEWHDMAPVWFQHWAVGLLAIFGTRCNLWAAILLHSGHQGRSPVSWPKSRRVSGVDIRLRYFRRWKHENMGTNSLKPGAATSRKSLCPRFPRIDGFAGGARLFTIQDGKMIEEAPHPKFFLDGIAQAPGGRKRIESLWN